MDEVKLLKVSDALNRQMIGFMYGTFDGMRESTVRYLKRTLQLDFPIESISVIHDKLSMNRNCLSIHINHDGEHYESCIVNMNYYTGAA